ncbi:hypothetical protein HG536_0A00980 [Torulaspora globosa]|uniref:RRM domain-containing protein n=1 Tax=Torulaspora globosa TaxID=48254 RepID=A0A7G3Z9U5_9SACH|nr:uncharacterized protein HG536_0A00980 [Torulaspora globosa]QLL30281.1 hypothetical protein HG536_0A00980 [Torulaspora globosa]
MTVKPMEKGNRKSLKRYGEPGSDENQVSASSSNCSTPRSCTNSASTSLDADFSKISLSGSSMNSQLEALANTNLLTVRIKLADRGDDASDEMQGIVSELEAVCHHHKGTFVNAANIEPYEYLADSRRLNVIEEHKDIYIFESGNVEFASASSSDSKETPYNYDKVIQVQFKRFNVLKSVCNVVQNILKSKNELIEKWSISYNGHALAQPGNLYVKGVPKDMLLDQVIPIFSKFGPVSCLKIICDNVTGESLGYGFVSYPLGSQASRCISELNGKKLGSSTLFINFHIERKERERIYRDNIKENSDDEKFRGVFVGNLPVLNSNNEVLTPEDVIKLFRERLAPLMTDLVIESVYFPRKIRPGGSQFLSEIDTEVENEAAKYEKSAEEGCEAIDDTKRYCPQHDDNPFKNYGFIKFANHAQAVKAIEVFNDFEWLGRKLVVNKAAQNKAQAYHHKKPLISTGFGNRGDNNYYPAPNLYGLYGGLGNLFFPYVNSMGSLSASSSDDTDLSDSEAAYPLNRSRSAGPYSPAFQTFEQMPSPAQAFDPSATGGTVFPMNAYGIISQSPPFALPLPTRDQQESNLYVKHIPLSWKDEDLYDFYQVFGDIISAKIITIGGGKGRNCEGQSSPISNAVNRDPNHPGTSRGYGFVCFKNPLDASRAILATNNFPLSHAHILHVSFAQKRARFGQSGVGSGHGQRANPDSHPFNPKLASNRASFNEHSRGQINVKFLNAMRQQRPSTGGPMPSNFLPRGGAWAGVPIAPPSVSHALPSAPFVPSSANTSLMMREPYVMHHPNSRSDDDEADDGISV